MTLRLVEGLIQFKPLDPVPVKGLAEPDGTGKHRTAKINAALTQNVTKKKTFTVNESK